MFTVNSKSVVIRFKAGYEYPVNMQIFEFSICCNTYHNLLPNFCPMVYLFSHCCLILLYFLVSIALVNHLPLIIFSLMIWTWLFLSGRVCSCQNPITWPNSCNMIPNLSQFFPMLIAWTPFPRFPTKEQHLKLKRSILFIYFLLSIYLLLTNRKINKYILIHYTILELKLITTSHRDYKTFKS